MKIRTRCGRTIDITRFAPRGLPAHMGREGAAAPVTAPGPRTPLP